MEPNRPVVAFLGVCDESMFQSLQGAPGVEKLDLLGLAKIVPYPFFPISFHKFEFVFAVSDQSLLNGSAIRLTSRLCGRTTATSRFPRRPRHLRSQR